eukprot:4800973-Pleurochrysis_carterae.AAC.1
MHRRDCALLRSMAVSMPTAELFGTWAVTAAAAAARVPWPRATVAIGDCDPAAAPLEAATSPKAQMRALLRGARELCQQWGAVSVPRKANGDADRLSHPDKLNAVRAEATRAGLPCTSRVSPRSAGDRCAARRRAGVAEALERGG